MARAQRKITFFEWVDREGQAAVSRLLSADLVEPDKFHAVRVHRAAKALHAPDEELISRCEEVLGASFDRAGTLDAWFTIRRARDAVEASAPTKVA